MKEEEVIKKIEEQIGKSNIKEFNPTATILFNKFQKELAKLRNKGKFDNKTYYKLYPLDAITPRLYGVISQ